MDILILTGRFGMGHTSAALSLARELRLSAPGARVEVEDFFAQALPHRGRELYKCFDLLVSRGSGLYNALYRRTEDRGADSLPLYALPLVEEMGRLLESRRPDGVVATHPLCAQLVSRCREEGAYTGRFATCVTDITAHSEWLTSHCDLYLVGAPQLREALIRKGVNGERILVTGIPVAPEFRRPVRRPAAGERHLLVMGGGLGLLPGSGRFYAALNALPGVRTTVLTGGNRRLYRHLAGRYERVTALGYTTQVWKHMAWAHLVLSKPGGVTLFEAVSSRLPILAWEPFLEQERRNADFLLRAGIGRVAPKEPGACLAAVEALLSDPRALEGMGRRMDALRASWDPRGWIGALERPAPGAGRCG